ncbi:uncharacterized protein CEXT_771911 [Caerostris extrusa]|uniref:Transmembrane inner ear expressed protein n=1 Tax=Caerostris extrusa TaxID=172846 RepID=A0AAV4UMG0_CAEEX|nr:uncharacterized protein CEXT_771911 [Caerostris extrusa]
MNILVLWISNNRWDHKIDKSPFSSFLECSDDGVENLQNPEPDWLETEVIAGFQVWQILFLVCAGLCTLVVVACCVTRWRIPHTRQEIEANHRRNQITQLFRCHLDRITVDEVDLMG